MALGTLRSGFSTSPAIEPADSKPRNAQPTNATAMSIVLMVLPELSGSPSNNVEIGLTRWKSNNTRQCQAPDVRPCGRPAPRRAFGVPGPLVDAAGVWEA
jgi:hypothetical protein